MPDIRQAAVGIRAAVGMVLLELAGHTFTSSLAYEWATIDSLLETMDTFGRQANWSVVQEAYTATFAPAGMPLSDLANLPATHAFAAEEATPMLHAYYGLPEATAFVEHATWGTGFAAGWDPVSRREMLTKGVAYRNVLYHVWHRLALGLSSCANDFEAQAGVAPGVFEWETAWALFAGEKEGIDGQGKGYSVYALGDKRCPQFGTCVNGDSPTSGRGGASRSLRRRSRPATCLLLHVRPHCWHCRAA